MNLDYTYIIRPRISDINYGGHVGHVELINLLHEVRVNFLRQFSLLETDIDGHVLMMRSLNIIYKNQAFWGNELSVNMKININGAKIIFDYTVFNTTLNNETAVAEAAMVLFDRKKERPIKPDIFIHLLKNINH